MLLVCLGLSGCRKSQPPAIDICIGDGIGGADCALRADSPLEKVCTKLEKGWFCPPSALKNSWVTTQDDMKLFSSWCYDAPLEVTQKAMESIQKQIK